MPLPSVGEQGSPSIERFGPTRNASMDRPTRQSRRRELREADRAARLDPAQPPAQALPADNPMPRSHPDGSYSIASLLATPRRGTAAFDRPKPVLPGVNVNAHCPYYHLVPKDPLENLDWREFVLDRCTQDPEFAEAVRQACAADILFWVNTFVWTMDPQRTDCPRIPMITWDEQDQCILSIQAADGNFSLWCEKARNQSLTWNVLVVYTHDFIFGQDSHHEVSSIKGDNVESGKNPNTLFSKIDCIIDMLPVWMRPRLNRTSKPALWENLDNDNTIMGEANNDDLGRSGRQKGIFLDEAPALANLKKIMGSVSSVTNSMIYAGTHQGPHTTFATEIAKPGVAVLRIHWTQRPAHRRGLYTFDSSGKPILLDNFRGPVRLQKETYDFPTNYPFEYVRNRLKSAGMTWEGRSLSPWFDNECHKMGYNKVLIASEMDIDPSGSAQAFFEPNLCDRIQREFVRPPIITGELDYDDRTGKPGKFIQKEGGRLRLWRRLNEAGRLSDQHEYGIACDISAGSGASSSPAVIVNLNTGEFVGVWACARTSPETFAMQVHALRMWCAKPSVQENKTVLTPAYTIFEANGAPGLAFGAKLLELDSSNIYHRGAVDRVTGEGSLQPGWYSDPSGRSKYLIFNRLLEGLRANFFIIPAEEIVQEMREYQTGPGAIPIHPGSLTDDLTNARNAHGDRVVATALAYMIVRLRYSEQLEAEKSKKEFAPPGSLASHMREVDEANRVAEMDLLPNEWEQNSRVAA